MNETLVSDLKTLEISKHKDKLNSVYGKRRIYRVIKKKKVYTCIMAYRFHMEVYTEWAKNGQPMWTKFDKIY